MASSLLRPDDLTSLVLRTDFTDDTAWQVLQAAIDSLDGYRRATCVSDPAYADETVRALIDVNALQRTTTR